MKKKRTVNASEKKMKRFKRCSKWIQSALKWRRGCGWQHCCVALRLQCYHHHGLMWRGILAQHCPEVGSCCTGLRMGNVTPFTRLVNILKHLYLLLYVCHFCHFRCLLYLVRHSIYHGRLINPHACQESTSFRIIYTCSCNQFAVTNEYCFGAKPQVSSKF